jgi:hypothetical protein
MLLGALALPAAASAQTVDKSRHLWATVNTCDTRKNPDTLGIRASMPGSGKAEERMYMRFRAQYFSEADNRWHNFTTRATDSGWQRVGSARFKARQSGWNFQFRPRKGQSFELRGAVRFEWRRGSKVVRRASKRTTAGHGTAVSDPKGYSSGTCRIGA